MKITVRIYKRYDLDLISLHLNRGFSLVSAMKQSLTAYVRNERLMIKPPTPQEMDMELVAKSYQFHLYLDEKDDSDLIDWISCTTANRRNTLLKHMLRGYLIGPVIYCFHESECSRDKNKENQELLCSNVDNIVEIEADYYRGVERKTRKTPTKQVKRESYTEEVSSTNHENDKIEKSSDIYQASEKLETEDSKAIENRVIEQKQASNNQQTNTTIISQESAVHNVSQPTINANTETMTQMLLNMQNMLNGQNGSTEQNMFNMQSMMSMMSMMAAQNNANNGAVTNQNNSIPPQETAIAYENPQPIVEVGIVEDSNASSYEEADDDFDMFSAFENIVSNR